MSTNFAEEFKLYENLFSENYGNNPHLNEGIFGNNKKNSADFNNQMTEFEDAVKRVGGGKDLSDIASDLTGSLRSTISEYKRFAEKASVNVGNSSKTKMYESKAAYILQLYNELIKRLKKPSNFSQAQIGISQAAAKILEGYTGESSSYRKIEQYGSIMGEIGSINADQKVKAAALKNYNDVIIYELTNDLAELKSEGAENMFRPKY